MTEHHDLSIFGLLPAVHRLRDGQQGGPLESLLGVIDQQVQHVVNNTRQMYDDWFIETCSLEMVPYVGELVGGTVSQNLMPGKRPGASRDRAIRMAFPRREVADAVSLQKRKGTLPVLEELAMSVAGWHAHANEWYPRVTQFQDMRRLGEATEDQKEQLLAMGQTVDVRKLWANGGLEIPFAQGAFFPDFKRPGAGHRPKNPKLIRLHLWRLQPHRITQGRPRCIWSCDCSDKSKPENSKPENGNAENGKLKVYTLDSSGLKRALCILPEPEASSTDLSDRNNLPMPLTIEELCDSTDSPKKAYYSRGKSVELWLENLDKDRRVRTFIPDHRVFICDLSWAMCGCKKNPADDRDTQKPCPCSKVSRQLIPIEEFKDPLRLSRKRVITPTNISGDVTAEVTAGDKKDSADGYCVAIDPENGLIAILANGGERAPVLATFHSLFSEEIGRGEYIRPAATRICSASTHLRFRNNVRCNRGPNNDCDLIELIQNHPIEKAALCSVPDAKDRYLLGHPGQTVIELADSDTYKFRNCTIQIPDGRSLEFRAGKRCFPTIELVGSACESAITFELGKGAKVTFDGLKFFNGRIAFVKPNGTGSAEADKHSVVCQPCKLDVVDPERRISSRHCTLVPVASSSKSTCGNTCPTVIENRLDESVLTIDHSIVGKIRQKQNGQNCLLVVDSIVDGQANDRNCSSDEAIRGDNTILLVERSTIFGTTTVREIELAQDTLFTKPVSVSRRQVGGMRFCFVPPFIHKNIEGQSNTKPIWNTPQQFYCQPSQTYERRSLPQNSFEATPGVPDLTWQSIQPVFTSHCFGDAGYGQLKTFSTLNSTSNKCSCKHEDNQTAGTTLDLISQGAESGSEIGVFHDLFQPQRQNNLDWRIEEFTPFPMHTELRFEN